MLQINNGCVLQINNGCVLQTNNGCVLQINNGCVLHIKNGCVLQINNDCVLQINNECVLQINNDCVLQINNGCVLQINTVKWKKLLSQLWLANLILDILRGTYSLIITVSYKMSIHKSEREHISLKSRGITFGHRLNEHFGYKPINSLQHALMLCGRENLLIVLELAKNLIDLVLPMDYLGYISVSQGAQGLAGMMSSIMSLVTIWYPLLRFMPS